MNRDFEKEYIEFAQNEIPDLWDRIEAGLSEKSAPETENKNKLKKIISWKKYAALAAAVLCAVIVIPAFMLTGQINSSSAADTSAPEQNYEAAAEEACEAAEEADDAGAGYGETTGSVDTAERAFDNAAAQETENSTIADMANDYAEGGNERYDESKEMEMVKESAKAEAASGAMADLGEGRNMQVISHIIIQVTEAEDAGKEQAESSLEGMAYTVIISQDPSGTFFEGEQIKVFVPDDFSMTLSAGKEFEIDLICEEDGEHPYMIGQVYAQ